MKHNLKKAKDLLIQNGYTCVLVKEDDILTSTQRGVKPLLEWLEQGLLCRGYSAADKVVGKGAAFLYVLLGVEEVFALVMSKEAQETLLGHGIEATCELCVDRIQNRTHTGYCPMEEAVWNITEPHAALYAIKEKLTELRNNIGN